MRSIASAIAHLARCFDYIFLGLGFILSGIAVAGYWSGWIETNLSWPIPVAWAALVLDIAILVHLFREKRKCS